MLIRSRPPMMLASSKTLGSHYQPAIDAFAYKDHLIVEESNHLPNWAGRNFLGFDCSCLIS